MPYNELIRAPIAEFAGIDTADTSGVLLTANVANHVKGIYVQLIAASEFDADFLLVTCVNATTTMDFLVDIGIGPATETVVIANLQFCNRAVAPAQGYLIPVHIPAGTRITARCQAATGGSTIEIAISLYGQGLETDGFGGEIITYGAATASSGGVNIDPGVTANLIGAFTELTAACTDHIHGFIISHGNNNDYSRTACNWAVSIAIGAGGAETIIHSYLINCDGSGDMVYPSVLMLPCDIPVGTRISIAAQCTINTAGDRIFDTIIYAWN